MPAPGDDTLIRRATQSDADAVWPLARDFATSFTLDRAAFDETFPVLVSRPDSLLLVATRRGDPVGYLLASARLTFHARGHVCWVEEVMVAADQRRRGIGRGLLGEAERWASELGSTYICLASRRAGDFYLALDYEDSATFYRKTLT
jgi:GNAT superfamily N-acetyltransferase